MPPTPSTTSLVSDGTTCAETASVGDAVMAEAFGEPGGGNAGPRPRTLNELLALSGLCTLVYYGSHAFAFIGYAPVMPRPDIEYELRLLTPPANAGIQLPSIVALIRENKRIKLVHGPREQECCHGWVHPIEEEEIAQILRELDQLRLATPGNPQGTQAKVMGTVLCLEKIEAAVIESDESILQQRHALDSGVGGFISAAFDTRVQRGLEGLLEWKVVLV